MAVLTVSCFLLSANPHLMMKCDDGCAGRCAGRGSAPAPPRFNALGPPAWGGEDCGQTKPTSGKHARAAVEDRAILRQFRHGCAIGGAIRHDPASSDAACFLSRFFAPSQYDNITPTPCWRPHAINLGGTGAEPLSSPPPAKLSLHSSDDWLARPASPPNRAGTKGVEAQYPARTFPCQRFDDDLAIVPA